MYKHILIPTDGSSLARAAAMAGIRLAKALGAKVTGFHASRAAVPLEYKGLFSVDYSKPAARTNAIRKMAAKHLDVIERAAKAAGVHCELEHVTDDYAAEAIVKAAKRKGCDLIFMPTHGRRGFKDSMLGSQTRKVLSMSKLPVLIHR